jgi:hypothetical protein
MFADFRIANSQGTAVFRLPTERLTTTLSKIILRVHGKAHLNNHRLQRIGLPGQRRTPIPLMEPVPPFSGIRKLTDSQHESTENSANFRYFGPAAVFLAGRRSRYFAGGL